MTCFIISSLPELYRSYKRGFCDIGWGMLILWLTGEIFGCVYAISLSAIPLALNYFLCFILTSPLIYFKRQSARV